MQGAGFLAGEKQIWLDFSKGAAIVDIASGETIRWITDPPNSASGNAQASQDGCLVALVGDFETAFLDGASPRLFKSTVPFGIRSPETSERFLRKRMTLGPDRTHGRLVAVTSPAGKTIQLINLGNLAPRPAAAFEHPDEVESVAFNDEGRLLVTGCADQSGRIWDIASNKQIGKEIVPDDRTAEVFRWRVATRSAQTGICPQVDARIGPRSHVLFHGGGRTASLWSHEGRRLAGPFAHPTGVQDLQFSPDGRHFAAFGSDGTVRLRETEDPEKPRVVLRNRAPERGSGFRVRRGRVSFHPTRSEMVVAGRWEEAVAWNWMQPDAPMFRIQPSGTPDRIARAEYTADGAFILTLSFDSPLYYGTPAFQLWHAESGKPASPPFGNEEVLNFSDMLLSPSPDDSALYACQDFRGVANRVPAVVCWDLNNPGSERPPRRWEKKFDGGVQAALSPDGTRLAVATREDFRVLDAKTGTDLSPAIEVPGLIIGLAVGADNRTVAVGCADGMAYVWRIGTTGFSSEQLLQLAELHSWRKVVNDAEIQPLSDQELLDLQKDGKPGRDLLLQFLR